MPPRYSADSPLRGFRPGRPERSIPRRTAAETRKSRDEEAGVRMRPFVGLFVGFLLAFRPGMREECAAFAAWFCFTRRGSHLRYRRIRVT